MPYVSDPDNNAEEPDAANLRPIGNDYVGQSQVNGTRDKQARSGSPEQEE